MTEKKEYEVNAKGREWEIKTFSQKKGVREGAINANTNRDNGSKELRKKKISPVPLQLRIRKSRNRVLNLP